MTGSLAFATDVTARLLEGGSLEHGDGCRIVRTPDNPDFRWGNFVLVDDARQLQDPERWAAVHRSAFPDADFVSIGVDDPDARFDEAAWLDAGFQVERSSVLRGKAAAIGAADPRAVPVADDADWADVLAVTLEDGPPEPGYRRFAARRVAAERRATAGGRAAWLGVRAGGRIVATLGVLPVGDGLARFQNVGTLAGHRRRGYAALLLRAAAALATERWGVRELVLVADPEGPAIGLYRRLGFEQIETQVELSRIGAS